MNLTAILAKDEEGTLSNTIYMVLNTVFLYMVIYGFLYGKLCFVYMYVVEKGTKKLDLFPFLSKFNKKRIFTRKK